MGDVVGANLPSRNRFDGNFGRNDALRNPHFLGHFTQILFCNCVVTL